MVLEGERSIWNGIGDNASCSGGVERRPDEDVLRPSSCERREAAEIEVLDEVGPRLEGSPRLLQGGALPWCGVDASVDVEVDVGAFGEVGRTDPGLPS